MDCDKKDVASVEQSLNTLISKSSHIKMDTYHAQLQNAEVAASMMKLGCYPVSYTHLDVYKRQLL